MNTELDDRMRANFIAVCQAVIEGRAKLVVCEVKPDPMQPGPIPVEEAYILCVEEPAEVMGTTAPIMRIMPAARMFTEPPFNDYSEPKRTIAQVHFTPEPETAKPPGGLILPPGVLDRPAITR